MDIDPVPKCLNGCNDPRHNTALDHDFEIEPAQDLPWLPMGTRFFYARGKILTGRPESGKFILGWGMSFFTLETLIAI